jgi:membrane AbrB-like protein
MSGLTKGVPPAGLIIACQVLLGTIIGCRFFGADPRMVGRALLLSLGATLITLCVTLAFALMFHRLFGQSWEQVVLAYAPGGLTEMSLVALAMRAEVAYVASHHILRVVLLISLAPIVLRLIRGKTGGQT